MPSRLVLMHGLNAPAVLPEPFEVRASHVLGTLPREQVSEFLSGLLIGAEVASMRDVLSWPINTPSPLSPEHR